MVNHRSLQMVNLLEEEEGLRIRLPILCHTKSGVIRNCLVETNRLVNPIEEPYHTSEGYLSLFTTLHTQYPKAQIRKALKIKKINYQRLIGNCNQVEWSENVTTLLPNYRGSYLVSVQKPQDYQLMFVEIVFNPNHTQAYEGIVFEPILYTWLKGKLKKVGHTVNGQKILERYIKDNWFTTRAYLMQLPEVLF